jgi:uncharacterized LabA/DUF88 family protein
VKIPKKATNKEVVSYSIYCRFRRTARRPHLVYLFIYCRGSGDAGPKERKDSMNSVERIALFIDGANLHATAKSLGFDVDYRRLLKEFQSRGNLLRAYYYTALVEDQEYSSIRPLIDWLDYNGFRVVTKPAKEYVDSTGRRKMKGNMDIELAIDALELAPFINHAVIFSGDGDFRSLVEALQRKGLKVSVVSTINSQPPMVADELRRQADDFIDIVSLLPKIGRDMREAPERAPREKRPARSAETIEPVEV